MLCQLDDKRDGSFVSYCALKCAALLNRATVPLTSPPIDSDRDGLPLSPLLPPSPSVSFPTSTDLAAEFIRAIQHQPPSSTSLDPSLLSFTTSNGFITITVPPSIIPRPPSPTPLPSHVYSFPTFPLGDHPTSLPPSPPPSFLLPSIAIFHSSFPEKFGTPRQPSLSPSSLGCLHLHPHIPVDTLYHLSSFSHLWLIFIFHLNPPDGSLHGKIRPPRLEGGKTGLFASRSPHRPSPVGLSVVKVERVEGRKVWVSGVDLVEGTPVIDIKPYHPADRVEGASWPDWVKEGGQGGAPQARLEVQINEGVERQITEWGNQGRLEWYKGGRQAVRAVRECIEGDPRTLNAKRHHRGRYGVKRGDEGGEGEEGEEEGVEECEDDEGRGSGEVIYGVSVDRMDVAFRVRWMGGGEEEVKGAEGGELGKDKEVAEVFDVELYEEGQERPRMRMKEWYKKKRQQLKAQAQAESQQS